MPENEDDISLEKYIAYLSTPEGQETTPMVEDSSPDTENIAAKTIVPVHTINIQHNTAAGSTFLVTGLGVVIPPEVAARMAQATALWFWSQCNQQLKGVQ